MCQFFIFLHFKSLIKVSFRNKPPQKLLIHSLWQKFMRESCKIALTKENWQSGNDLNWWSLPRINSRSFIPVTSRNCTIVSFDLYEFEWRSINHGCSAQIVIGHWSGVAGPRSKDAVAQRARSTGRYVSASRLGDSSGRRLAADRHAFITGDPVPYARVTRLSVAEPTRGGARTQFARTSRADPGSIYRVLLKSSKREKTYFCESIFETDSKIVYVLCI